MWSMLPAGLVWGRGAGGAVDGSAMLAAAAGAYGVPSPATVPAQPLVYCYNPAAAAGVTDLPGVSLTYPHHQLQQQQQMLLAAKAQQMYVQTRGLGLQPYQLHPSAAAASSNTAALQLHAPLALATPGANLPYLSPDAPIYQQLPSTLSPAADVTPTSIALTSARKVRH